MFGFALEIRHAARRLGRAPRFTTGAAMTLAIGLSATVSMFGIVNAVLIRPLPFPESDRLVTFYVAERATASTKGGLSEQEFAHFQNSSRTLQEIGAYVENVVTVTDGDQPERVPVALVTPSVLTAIGAMPAHGRLFVAADGEPGAPVAVVLAHGLWVRRYGADPSIVGRTIEVNRKAVQVVGVLRPRVDFPRRETQIWYCLAVEAAPGGPREPSLRGLARLRSGIASASIAESELDGHLAALAGRHPLATELGRLKAVVVPLKEEVVREARMPLWMLLCSAALVLFIAWANVANLLLLRAENQRGDLAVHLALGASRGQLVGRFVAEGLLLSVTASALAAPLAVVAIKWRFGLSPQDIPRLYEVGLDGTILVLGLVLVIATALVIALVGMRQALRMDMGAALASGANFATSRPGQIKAQRFLVGLQFGLSFVLLIVAGLMVQSFWSMQNAKLGFDPGTLVVRLSLPVRPYPSHVEAAAFYERLLSELLSIPGIERAGAVSWLPLTVSEGDFTTDVATSPTSSRGRNHDAPSRATLALVTPGYFDAMRIRLLEGRSSVAEPLTGETASIVVSAALARGLFGSDAAAGQRLRIPKIDPDGWYAIVGVADDVPGESIATGPSSVIYFPAVPTGPHPSPLPLVPRDMTLVIRTTLPLASVTQPVRATIRTIDPMLATSSVQPMSELVRASTARTRLAALLLFVSAAGAVLLTIVGIYGVQSYAVNLRSREIGTRLMLGATPTVIERSVLRDGALIALSGIVVGCGVALGLGRTLEALVFEVRPTDPVTYGAASAFLLLAGVVASYFPARRAAATEPARLLRVR